MLLCDGGQFFEELGEEDRSEDLSLFQGDAFGFGWWRTPEDPSCVTMAGAAAFVWERE